MMSSLLQWLGWGGFRAAPASDRPRSGLLVDLEALNPPFYICDPRTRVVLYWVHLHEKLFARKGLAVSSSTFNILPTTNEDQVVLTGATEKEGETWQVTIWRSSSHRSKYIANVRVGEEELQDLLVFEDNRVIAELKGSPKPEQISIVQNNSSLKHRARICNNQTFPSEWV